MDTNPDRTVSGAAAPPILAVEALTRSFGGLTAVDRCSFRVDAGRITGIIGPNGAGKTTIFNMVAGALPPSSGRILFDGDDVSSLPTHELFHRGIVRTFQIPHEFGRLTVLENLMVVPTSQPGERLWRVWTSPARVRRREREVWERAEDTLRFLTLWDLRDELATNLSGGQKKLLELGRAMMTEPRLVLLDEPGAGVNPTLLVKLRDMIRQLNQRRGYTFVIIEHDMDLIASLCERVIVLAEGSVLTEGTMDAVRRDPRVIDAYLGGGGEGGAAHGG
ncbi:MAG: ABC transporter ATP-binding protein [Immundisolibacterales bacterium]|nr:ABC transporter ATP-binding protein [Immundisolibacterales bacterium]